MNVKPEHYREQAERSRALAKQTRDKDISAHLCAVAEQYEKLAEDAENAG